jgi:hypothetical protein
VPELPSGFDNARLLFADELGACYVADQAERGGEEVAVRLLTLTVPNRVSRRQFRSTCLAATALAGQPGVLALREADFTADLHPYLVTDVPGGTLAAGLADGPMPTQAAAGLGVRLATTLAAAHAAGVLHLDVRPANVMRCAQTSVPLLANFSVAHAVSAAGQAELPIECLLHAGRELFGWDTPGPPADVYGLASTLYTVLAGQAPHAGEARLGRAALYQRVLRGGPPPIARPGIPPQVTTLLAAMMDPNPANRPDLGQVSQILANHADNSRLTVGWTMPAVPEQGLTSHAQKATVVMASPVADFERLAAPPALPTPIATGPDPATSPLGVLFGADSELATPAVPAPPATPPPAGGLGGSSPLTNTAPLTRRRRRIPGESRRGGARHVGLMLLIAAGVLALVAGYVWGIVTGSHPEPGPSLRATTSAGPISPAQLARYLAKDVKVSVRRTGILVTWSAPATMTDVNAFLVIPKVPGQQAQVVARTARSAIFSGLPSGHRYCFVVGTLIESGAGKANTAATKPVCKRVAKPHQRHKRTRRTHNKRQTTTQHRKNTTSR